MKRVLAILSLAAVFAACNGDQTSKTAALVDTTAIKQRAVAEEQARLKAQKEEADRVAIAARRTSSSKSSSSRRSSPGYVYSEPAVGSSANPVTTGSGSAVQQPVKQGMSSRTKGALIGAGAGAIAGGIIGHNIKGAIIGGAVGAGTGYIIGRKKDKKTGRLPNN
jgi:hypothetical protein